MPDTDATQRTRRRFLGAGATLGLAALAGCNDTAIGDLDSESPTATPRDQDTDSNTGEPSTSDYPRHPAAYFAGADGSTFTTHDLQRYVELDPTYASRRPFPAPDTSAFNIDFTNGRLTVTFNAYFARPVRLGIIADGPGFPDVERFTDAPDRIDTHDFPATDERDTKHPDAYDLDRHEATFDLSHVEYPENISTHFYLCIQDLHWQESGFTEDDFLYHVLSSRTVAKVRYTYPDGDTDARWLTHHELTPRVQDITGNHRAAESFSYNFRAANSNYAVTAALTRASNGFWAAPFTIDRHEMEDYRDNGDGGIEHMTDEALTNRIEIQRLAQHIWDAQTKLGITDILARVQGVARLVQHIPYKRASPYRKPSFRLYDQRVNCTEGTTVFATILAQDPFDLRVAYIAGELPDRGHHMMPGIDLTHLRDSRHDTSGFYTERPEDHDDYYDPPPDIPNHDYALVEITNPGFDIGDHYDFHIHYFGITNYGEGVEYWKNKN